MLSSLDMIRACHTKENHLLAMYQLPKVTYERAYQGWQVLAVFQVVNSGEQPWLHASRLSAQVIC